ncbi:HNH endonuclease [Shewanella algae]|nr:HNH endonuclease [Shewanella algae]
MSSIFNRLKKKQVIGDRCWSWSGYKDDKGYGLLSNRNGSGHSPERAHRVSYELNFGEIPDGLVVRHTCDNPECTNPEHLVLGTQKDNMRDCSNRNRLNIKSLENLVSGAAGYRGAAIEKNKVA